MSREERDADAEVGRLVMGYEGEPFHFCTRDGTSISAWVDRGGPWYTVGELREWLEERQRAGALLDYHIAETRRFPHYTTDASDDYAVLVKVRDTWDVIAVRSLSANLRYVWHERNQSGAYPMETFYQPGDYSKAALAVLKAKEQA